MPIEGFSNEAIALFAAALSALATAFAAIAAWRVPSSTAKLAERLRQEAEESSERRRLQNSIFSALMQHRASIASKECVRALNMIDVVFHDVQPVREAWAELYVTLSDRSATEHDQRAKLRDLLRKMAKSIGIDQTLRTDDFGRVYYPQAHAEEDELRAIERQLALEQYRHSKQGNRKVYSPFPPKPRRPE